MYTYQQPSLFSGKRGLALLVVILLHILVAWGFYSGLARRISQTIIPPVEIAQIDKPKQDDKPPPPPPKLEDIKPYVPPPEFVDVQVQTENTNAITQTTQSNAPAPAVVAAPVAEVQHSRTSIGVDPKHPLKIGEDYYPDASKRAGEEGTCKIKLTVAANGQVTGAEIAQSSGFPRLDEACLKAVKGAQMKPATEDGKPVESTVMLPLTWKLKN